MNSACSDQYSCDYDYDDDDFTSATMCCICGGGGPPPAYTVVFSDTVTAFATAAGSVSDFDQAALKQSFAVAFGATTSQITISIAAQNSVSSSYNDGRRLSETSYLSGTAGYMCQGYYAGYKYTMPPSAPYSATDCQAECSKSATCVATTFKDMSGATYCASNPACPT